MWKQSNDRFRTPQGIALAAHGIVMEGNNVPSITAARPHEVRGEAASDDATDRFIERRVTWIWALLVFNVLPALGGATVVPIPRRVAQVLAAAALALALVLALTLNRRLVVRPNVVLSLYSVLAVTSLLTSVRGMAGVGAVLRSFRLIVFLLVLWLLTPFWGRRDLLLAKCHLRAVSAVGATIAIGLLVAPSMARPNGRLVNVIWPMPSTAVGHFGAVMAGIAIVLWLSSMLTGKRAVLLGAGGFLLILLSQARSALVSFFVAVAFAALSLFLARTKVRRVTTIVLVVAPLAVIALAPAFLAWFQRDQTSAEIAGLTGRRRVWSLLLAAPRSEVHQWLGYGLSDKSFDGMMIDNSWLAVYHDQGLVGVAIVATILLFLILAAAFRRPSPARATAIFLILYCGIDSYTEVGLGDASPYLLEVVVAASLLVAQPKVEHTSRLAAPQVVSSQPAAGQR